MGKKWSENLELPSGIEHGILEYNVDVSQYFGEKPDSVYVSEMYGAKLKHFLSNLFYSEYAVRGT